MSAAEISAALLAGALLLYVLFGGADFGGGICDLLSRGPRAADERKLIERAMAPVWEANHVWVIFAVVVLFTAFPPAFALMSVVLHVPLTLMLVGIVVRGSAFVFRQYGFLDDMAVERWGRLFAAASVITPFCLGAILGTITSGQLPLPESLRGADLFLLWLRPFPLAVALLTVALFTFLAAVYLTNETADMAMQDSFRRRAFLAAFVVAIAEVLCGLALERDGGHFHERLTGAPLARFKAWAASLSSSVASP